MLAGVAALFLCLLLVNALDDSFITLTSDDSSIPAGQILVLKLLAADANGNIHARVISDNLASSASIPAQPTFRRPPPHPSPIPSRRNAVAIKNLTASVTDAVDNIIIPVDVRDDMAARFPATTSEIIRKSEDEIAAAVNSTISTSRLRSNADSFNPSSLAVSVIICAFTIVGFAMTH